LFTSSCLAFVLVVILDLEDCIELHLEECMFFFWLSLFTSNFLAFVLFVILSKITSRMLMTVCIDSAVAAHFKLFASYLVFVSFVCLIVILSSMLSCSFWIVYLDYAQAHDLLTPSDFVCLLSA